MSDSCWGKTVDVAVLEARQKRVLIIVLAINAATFLMVLAAALMARSANHWQRTPHRWDSIHHSLPKAICLASLSVQVAPSSARFPLPAP